MNKHSYFNSKPFANSYIVLTVYAIFSEIQCLVVHEEAQKDSKLPEIQ